jgi:hypothetical protein
MPMSVPRESAPRIKGTGASPTDSFERIRAAPVMVEVSELAFGGACLDAMDIKV